MGVSFSLCSSGPQGPPAAFGPVPTPQGEGPAGGGRGLVSLKTKSTQPTGSVGELSKSLIPNNGRDQGSFAPYSPAWHVARARSCLKAPDRHIRDVDPQAMRISRCRRRLLAAAGLVERELRRGSVRVQAVMVTLTYGKEASFDSSGAPVWRAVEWAPGHIRSYCEAVRHWCRRRGFVPPIVWTAELQARGAVHYHVLVWLPVRLRIPKPDASGQWPHGLSNIGRARRPVAYLAKYASKPGTKGAAGELHALPKGARLYGVSGLSETARPVYHWLGLSGWLQAVTPYGTRARRIADGFWHVEETGVELRSPWLYEGPTPGGGGLQRFVWAGFRPCDIRAPALLPAEVFDAL